MSLNTFIPDEEVLKMRKVSQLVSKEGFLNRLLYGDKINDSKKVYTSVMTVWTESGYYRYDDILANYVDTMNKFKKNEVANLA